ncbi:uncharacterized protein LOC134290835 [Aedes albopictus]|uniref:Reverse transcriptase domain-containing protein n=1 Tax=Aedes albopictus TaxID=7160 RepID=A0ABM1XTE2_AEDAL
MSKHPTPNENHPQPNLQQQHQPIETIPHTPPQPPPTLPTISEINNQLLHTTPGRPSCQPSPVPPTAASNTNNPTDFVQSQPSCQPPTLPVITTPNDLQHQQPLYDPTSDRSDHLQIHAITDDHRTANSIEHQNTSNVGPQSIYPFVLRSGPVDRTLHRYLNVGLAQSSRVLQHASPGVSPDDDVWIYYQNVRGLRTKLDDLYLTSFDCDFDVIMMTETGLDDSIHSTQAFGQSFNVYRCDRGPSNSDKHCFGGVLIAVSERHSSSGFVSNNGRRLEQVCVSANVRGTRFLMCNVYIPPDKSRDADLLEEHIATVREICDYASPGDIVLVCGDYNQPHIAWAKDDSGTIRFVCSSQLSPAGTSLVDGMDFLNLIQANTQLNHLGRTLDLVFASDVSRVSVDASEESLLPIDTHHPPLNIRINIATESTRFSPLTSNGALNYPKIDFDCLSAFLSDLDWNCIYDCTDINDMAFNFCNTICQWLNENAPLKKKPLSPPWSTPLLRKLKRERNKWQRHLRSHKTTFAKSNFKRAERVASRVTPDAVDLDTFEISSDMIVEASKKLKNSFAPGPDGIPAVVFRRCISAVAEPLSFIFRQSFEQGEFPTIWKTSYMFPVHKSGDKKDVKNYRGITSLSTASKLFEIIVSDRLMRASKAYISSDQHGFIPGRSVATNLLDLTTTCLTAMEERMQVDVIYTDLKAAFDKIDHKVLICKLSRLGISNRLLAWFSSYLTDRKLCVKHGAYVSAPFVASSGVPQGSNLGPLLFVIFFNDAASTLGFKCKLVYADDLKIYMVVRSIEDCLRLQTLLNMFAQWCEENKLVISVPKCQVMTFYRSKDPIMFDYHINGSILKRVDEVTDLGIILDRQLSFQSHYASIISKANRQLGFVFKIAKDFTDPHCLKSLYCFLVRPILENASVVWAPHDVTWNLRIERVQKR